MTIKCGYVDISAGQVHYRHKPGEGMPIIYFHQTASSSKMWLKVMERLDGVGPQYAFDTPGFGGSFDCPDEMSPSMTDYAEWAYEAVAALGISKAHVVGHHTGVCISTEMVHRHPELAQSITMIGPVPLTEEERNEFAKHFGTPFTPTVSGSYLNDNWHYLDRLGAHADVDLFHREMWDMLRAWQGRVKSYGAVWDQDFMTMYKEVSAPLLIMCAHDDVLFPFFDRAKELRPDATALQLNGANFEPDLDPDTVTEAIVKHMTASS